MLFIYLNLSLYINSVRRELDLTYINIAIKI